MGFCALFYEEINKMPSVYDHHEVESRWQKVWDDEKAFAAPNDFSKPKYYALVEFPYPRDRACT